jgi:peptidoglycan/LPS O-acetylase OafA/YrhL
MLTTSRSMPLAAASRWDSVGQLLSALCVAHCVGLPVVLGFLPAALAEVLEGEAVHQGLIAFVGLSALAAFVPGYRRHRRAAVVGLAVAALALLVAAAFLVPEEAEALETGLTLGGGVLMAIAHARNRA